MKNIFLFVAAIFGTVFLVAGVVTIGRNDHAGWLYLLLALLCYILAAEPGRRVRDFLVRRPPHA